MKSQNIIAYILGGLYVAACIGSIITAAATVDRSPLIALASVGVLAACVIIGNIVQK